MMVHTLRGGVCWSCSCEHYSGSDCGCNMFVCAAAEELAYCRYEAGGGWWGLGRPASTTDVNTAYVFCVAVRFDAEAGTWVPLLANTWHLSLPGR